MPVEVWYYVVIPIVIILLIYLFFTIVYRNKKNSHYYSYVVDYVYSTLGIIFSTLLLCLLLGYSLATIHTIMRTGYLSNYLFLTIILVILPFVPLAFLIYVIKIYLHNLKRKVVLDATYKNELEPEKNEVKQNELDESEFELKKKNS